jgi:hypothetical protein
LLPVEFDASTELTCIYLLQRENGLRIVALSDDYLTVTTNTYLWKDSIEAPAMVKLGGRYYMFGSHLTGWDPNDNVYSTSTSLTSGWSAWKTFADSGSKTYTSQTNYVLRTGDSAAIYLGDRWVSKNLMASTYVWLPLTISSGGSVVMKNAVSWVAGAAGDGTVQAGAPPAETSYEGEAATYGGKARDVSCSACSGGKAAGYIGGSDKGSVTFAGGTYHPYRWGPFSTQMASADGLLWTSRYTYFRQTKPCSQVVRSSIPRIVGLLSVQNTLSLFASI